VIVESGMKLSIGDKNYSLKVVLPALDEQKGDK